MARARLNSNWEPFDGLHLSESCHLFEAIPWNSEPIRTTETKAFQPFSLSGAGPPRKRSREPLPFGRPRTGAKGLSIFAWRFGGGCELPPKHRAFGPKNADCLPQKTTKTWAILGTFTFGVTLGVEASAIPFYTCGPPPKSERERAHFPSVVDWCPAQTCGFDATIWLWMPTNTKPPHSQASGCSCGDRLQVGAPGVGVHFGDIPEMFDTSVISRLGARGSLFSGGSSCLGRVLAMVNVWGRPVPSATNRWTRCPPEFVLHQARRK